MRLDEDDRYVTMEFDTEQRSSSFIDRVRAFLRPKKDDNLMPEPWTDRVASLQGDSMHVCKRFLPWNWNLTMQSLPRIAHLTLLGLTLLVVEYLAGGILLGPDPMTDFDPIHEYGLLVTIIFYLLKCMTLFTLPISVINLVGILVCNTSPRQPSLKSSPLISPFICFRVVTKGMYPNLVKNTVHKNIEACNKVSLTNFQFEIVTDTRLGLPESRNVREIVVPDSYKTKRGALYKARALHYCWEEDVNMLSESDWIVHLDEETLLKESAVIGIVNFVTEGKYDFGQGVITYTNGEIVNWITTLADSVRVGFDYCMLQFCLSVLHKPLFSWKGSFVVTRASAEKMIGYDFGPEGSIAEDCYFAMIAWKRGYSFDFIQGEMCEKSPFTFMDFIKQRKRWMQGITLTYESKEIPRHCKTGLVFMVYAWIFMPFTSTNIILNLIYPIPVWQSVNCVFGVMGGVMVFLFILGAIKSFSVQRLGVVKYILLCFAPVLCIPVAIVLESIGVTWGLLTKKTGFDIVNKEHDKLVVTSI